MFGKKNKNEVQRPVQNIVDNGNEFIDTGINNIDIIDEDIDFDVDDFSTPDTNEVDTDETLVNADGTEVDTVEEDEKPRDLILYIIIDKNNPSLLQYYRECGVNVSKVFTNINDAKDTLLMQIEPVKILIVDTGTGRFSAMGSRKELIDLMGICDEDARISVYYTDTVIKSEVEYNGSFEERDIHWHKFKSNTDVVAHLLRNKGKENYIYDNEDKDKVKEVADDILDITGFKFREQEQFNLGDPSITANDVIIHMAENESAEDLIEGYVITRV